MSRIFKKMRDVVPHRIEELSEYDDELTIPFFTVAETAQIAKMYAQVIEDNRDDPCNATAKIADRWRKKFEGWQNVSEH